MLVVERYKKKYHIRVIQGSFRVSIMCKIVSSLFYFERFFGVLRRVSCEADKTSLVKAERSCYQRFNHFELQFSFVECPQHVTLPCVHKRDLLGKLHKRRTWKRAAFVVNDFMSGFLLF